jgi:hypothetical protein
MSTRGIPQGPHTVGYSAKLKALHLSKGKIKVRHFVYEQIMDPDAWKEAVIKQLNDDDAFSGDTESSLRLLRAYRDYLAHYAELMRALEGNSKHDAYDLIEEMLQLDPFATYKWWDPKSAKKTHLKYKGENSDLSNPKNIDTNASFKDSQSYKLHLEDVQQMLDFDYIPPDEDDVIDEEEFSDDESESSTTTTNGNATNNGMDIEDEL